MNAGRQKRSGWSVPANPCQRGRLMLRERQLLFPGQNSGPLVLELLYVEQHPQRQTLCYRASPIITGVERGYSLIFFLPVSKEWMRNNLYTFDFKAFAVGFPAGIPCSCTSSCMPLGCSTGRPSVCCAMCTLQTSARSDACRLTAHSRDLHQSDKLLSADLCAWQVAQRVGAHQLGEHVGNAVM